MVLTVCRPPVLLQATELPDSAWRDTLWLENPLPWSEAPRRPPPTNHHSRCRAPRETNTPHCCSCFDVELWKLSDLWFLPVLPVPSLQCSYWPLPLGRGSGGGQGGHSSGLRIVPPSPAPLSGAPCCSPGRPLRKSLHQQLPGKAGTPQVLELFLSTISLEQKWLMGQVPRGRGKGGIDDDGEHFWRGNDVAMTAVAEGKTK